MDFEFCTDSVDGAIAASKFNLKRIELCTALELGGLTPSYGLLTRCVEQTSAEVHVMIRPKAGNFIYDRNDILIMQRDIIGAKSGGAKGVVFGLLDKNNKIDVQQTLILVETAKKLELEVTFHRAIDLCSKWQEAIEHLANLGVDRILTSGGEPKAIEGINQIAEMVRKAEGRIQIMAGSGVSPLHADSLARTGVNALHFTARKSKNEISDLNFGQDYEVDHDKIQGILAAIV